MSKFFSNRNTDASQHTNIRAQVELLYSIIALAILIVFSWYLDIDLVETLYDFTRDHEDWELDEFIFSFLWIAVVATIYAIRRLIDIIELNKTNEYNANHDSLTGLPNRAFAQYLMGKMLHRAKRDNHSVVVIFLDLNDFKNINDSFGHDHGDLLIKKIGNSLSSIIRDEEVVSRLGGDEFLVLAEFFDGINSIQPIIKRIQQCTKNPFDIYGKPISSSFSIGIAASPEHGESVNSLLAAADTAMYEAKRNKDTPVFFYTNEIGERNREYIKLSSNLKSAIINKDLHLVFQPIVNTYSGKIEGYEALTRWALNGKRINPEHILSIAEKIGLSETFFCWLVDTALEDSASFQTPDQFISINVTVKQFLSENFLTILKDATYKHKNKIINLEITESSILADYEKAINIIRRLRKLGIKVMIDDFGTGYSSLGRLQYLDIDKIKIDKSFLVNAELNGKSAKIFESIFALATTLEIGVVAEGLETIEQLQFLRKFPPMLTQGYLLQKPTVKEHQKPESTINKIMK